jgi:hypothetical protein
MAWMRRSVLLGGWAALALGSSEACLGQAIVTTRVGPPGFGYGGVDVRVGPFVPPPVYIPGPVYLPAPPPPPRIIVPRPVVVMPRPAPVRVISATERDELRFQDAYNRLFSKHDNSRRDGARILGQLGDLRAVPSLGELLLNDDDSDVRQACARALGQIGDHGSLPVLREAAARDRKEKVRDAAAWAYRQIQGGIRISAPATLGETIIEGNANSFEPGIRYSTPAQPSTTLELEPAPAPAPRLDAPRATAPGVSVPPPPPDPGNLEPL